MRPWGDFDMGQRVYDGATGYYGTVVAQRRDGLRYGVRFDCNDGEITWVRSDEVVAVDHGSESSN